MTINEGNLGSLIILFLKSRDDHEWGKRTAGTESQQHQQGHPFRGGRNAQKQGRERPRKVQKPAGIHVPISNQYRFYDPECSNLNRELEQQASLEASPELDHSPGGDRYIPKRKLVKRESMLSEEDPFDDSENRVNPQEGQGVSLSDLYLRLVMVDSPRKRKQAPIDSFENTNILRFNTRPQNAV